MAASQLWYVPHRPDLLLLAPCDEEGPLPCPGSMYVTITHLHPPERPEARWRHPRSNAFLTCFGELATQQPRVVRCACGASPCKMRGLEERGGVPDELIPGDWATKYEPPPTDPTKYGPEGRRSMAVQLYLDCTGKAESELPPAEGQEHASEESIQQAAEVMLTDYLKGRVCFQCNLPSTRMQKCARCHQARYCSKECQRAGWGAHKPQCDPSAAASQPAAAPEAKPAQEQAAAAAAKPEVAVAAGEVAAATTDSASS
ncbi:hypothetical protein PLESTB_001788900 [Pleodorina starrii]|uniref:MYND-type domain-containing protein n=1 Tax=Pleodorina starrii TaxID=330485 RepID=A0A9W6FAG4_9CHLO|nr:hypothetical protein PLESTB_001788900 [Pleodorina starrii]GLC76513.1 hypothetical protein PLESTF_001791100 [Pleodorina starrii]